MAPHARFPFSPFPVGWYAVALSHELGARQRRRLTCLGERIVIWTHKRYVHPPALSKGDGPVGLYRRWARQFYPEPSWPREVPGGELGGESSVAELRSRVG